MRLAYIITQLAFAPARQLYMYIRSVPMDCCTTTKLVDGFHPMNLQNGFSAGDAWMTHLCDTIIGRSITF